MSVIQPVDLIALSHILNGREVLQVPRGMQPTKQRMLQWHDVIYMMVGRAVEIDLLYSLLEAGNGRSDNARLATCDIVSIPLWVGFLPCALGLPVSLLIRGLPVLGALIVSGSKLWIIFPHALLNGAAGSFVFLTPIHSAYVSAPTASTIAGLPVGEVPMDAWLACEKLSESALARFGSRDYFLHHSMLSRVNVSANDVFNFKLEAA